MFRVESDGGSPFQCEEPGFRLTPSSNSLRTDHALAGRFGANDQAKAVELIAFETSRALVLLDKIFDRCWPIPHCGCWIWTGWMAGKGYGQIKIDGRSWLLHRLTYTLYHGPIPHKFHVDHLCRVRSCCNPHHLEAVTPRENTYRGEAVLFGAVS